MTAPIVFLDLSLTNKKAFLAHSFQILKSVCMWARGDFFILAPIIYVASAALAFTKVALPSMRAFCDLLRVVIALRTIRATCDLVPSASVNFVTIPTRAIHSKPL